MKYGWVALVWLTVSGRGEVPAAMGQARARRTPKAVVVAKQKLVDIANGPARRRHKDLLTALEGLFTDFGLQSPRAAANDLLEGRYGFFHALDRKDRMILAPVVAHLVDLFPTETGLGARLREQLSTLSRLQTDEQPTVAQRARWLVQLATGKKLDVPKGTAVTLAHSFLKKGRAALQLYGAFSDEQLAQLRTRLPEIESLGQAEIPILEQRRQVLMHVANRTASGLSEREAMSIAKAFLARGKEGLLDLRVFKKGLGGRLREQWHVLDRLAQDEDPIIAERAALLMQFADGKEVPLAIGTMNQIAAAFLKQGRRGLEDYQLVSKPLRTQLADELPALEVLTKDSDADVAQRARWLIKLLHEERDIDKQSNTLTQYAWAFLKRGRAGLLDQAVSPGQIGALIERLPELVHHCRDSDPAVANAAKELVKTATGIATRMRGSQLRRYAHAFLKKGRAGLVDTDIVSDKRLTELIERLPELERFARDANPKVARSARILIRVAKQEEVLERKGATLVPMVIAFLERGRHGLFDYRSISDQQIAKLIKRRAELERLAQEQDPIASERANILLQAIERRDLSAYKGNWLKALASSFLRTGRDGLVRGRRRRSHRQSARANETTQRVEGAMDDLMGMSR